MVSHYGALIFTLGLGLTVLGIVGIWLAMNTPMQLQPIPFLSLILGLIVMGLGAVVVWAG